MKASPTPVDAKQHKPVVVGRIYAHWCKFCKEMDGDWKEMKTRIDASKFKDAVIIRDIESENETAGVDEINRAYLSHVPEKFRLFRNHYPTLFKIEDGKLHYYNGSRTADALFKWAITPAKQNMQGGKSRQRRRKTPQNKSPPHNKTRKHIWSFFKWSK
jgi:thiol-disulfide isomerase/thioredoxin